MLSILHVFTHAKLLVLKAIFSRCMGNQNRLQYTMCYKTHVLETRVKISGRILEVKRETIISWIFMPRVLVLTWKLKEVCGKPTSLFKDACKEAKPCHPLSFHTNWRSKRTHPLNSIQNVSNGSSSDGHINIAYPCWLACYIPHYFLWFLYMLEAEKWHD